MKKWTRALYQPNLPLTPAGYVTASPGASVFRPNHEQITNYNGRALDIH